MEGAVARLGLRAFIPHLFFCNVLLTQGVSYLFPLCFRWERDGLCLASVIHAVGDGSGAKGELLSHECFIGGPLYHLNSLGNQGSLAGGGKELSKWAELASVGI